MRKQNRAGKKIGKAWAVLMGAAILSAGLLTACGGQTPSATETSAAKPSAEVTEAKSSEPGNSPDASEPSGQKEPSQALSGTISLSGSTSMEKMSNAVAESFMEKYPDVTVTPEFTGSSAGVEAVLSGKVNIGNSSRALKDSEKEAGAVENIVAIDGIAVVVDPANPVKSLTRDQLASIYTGSVQNWSQIGGSDAPIVVVGREAGSGTRGAFEELLEIEDKCSYASELESTGAVMAKIASTPGAIGYVSLDVIDNTVTPLALDGVEATVENIKAGKYFLSRPFVMATKGEISEQEPLVQAFFDYLESDEGKSVIAGAGLILPD